MCRSSPILGSVTVNMPVLIAPAVTVAFKLQIKTTVRLLDNFVTPDLSIAGSLFGPDDVPLWSLAEEHILFEIWSALPTVDVKCNYNKLIRKEREIALRSGEG